MAEAKRIAILGVGHPLRRDDAAGLEACERIRAGLRDREDVLVLTAGPAPENFVGALRDFAPHHVILLDAALMGEPPGTVRRILPCDGAEIGGSTHSVPLAAFCDYVSSTLACPVELIGIEPADTGFGEALTPPVRLAVERVAQEAIRTLGMQGDGVKEGLG
jgi:hydrogenase 3 maturation protease